MALSLIDQPFQRLHVASLPSLEAAVSNGQFRKNVAKSSRIAFRNDKLWVIGKLLGLMKLPTKMWPLCALLKRPKRKLFFIRSSETSL
jgi:hypothetical protein